MTSIQSAQQTPQLPSQAPATRTEALQAAAQEKAQTPSQLSEGDHLQTYTVKKGDTLWDISKAKLGDPSKWNSIFALNKDQIKNPDLIYPKQVLSLPLVEEAPAPAQPMPQTPVAEEPAAPPVAAEPETPPAVPAEPTPVAEAPETPAAPPAIVAEPAPTPASDKHPGILGGAATAALIGGAIGTGGTAAALMVKTASLGAPLSNLGGYAAAQSVAKSINALTGKVGLTVPSGPALSKLISRVGGPKVAAAGVAIGVGVAAAGVAVGGYYLYQHLHNDQ